MMVVFVSLLIFQIPIHWKTFSFLEYSFLFKTPYGIWNSDADLSTHFMKWKKYRTDVNLHVSWCSIQNVSCANYTHFLSISNVEQKDESMWCKKCICLPDNRLNSLYMLSRGSCKLYIRNVGVISEIFCKKRKKYFSLAAHNTHSDDRTHTNTRSNWSRSPRSYVPQQQTKIRHGYHIGGFAT